MGIGFNPRLPRGKATFPLHVSLRNLRVSIHAFREGRRLDEFETDEYDIDVSIHAFREGRRHPVRASGSPDGTFQSTPSAREGDSMETADVGEEEEVSIHAFREGRRPSSRLRRQLTHTFQSTPSAREGDLLQSMETTDVGVSIHAFREGRRRSR